MKRVTFVGALIFTAGCGGNILDLGTNDTALSRPPETLDDAGAGVPGVPTVFAAHQHGISALAIDDTRIYWGAAVDARPFDNSPDAGAVRSCAKENCRATLITYATAQYSRRIVVDKSRIYWVGDSNGIYVCPIEGCAGAPVLVAANYNHRAFAVDESSLYWRPSSGRLYRCSLQDCGGTSTFLAETGTALEPDGADTLASDSVYLYWVAPTTGANAISAVMRVRKDGSAPAEAIIPGLHQPRTVAVSPTSLFWTENSTLGSLKSCPLNGCTGEPTVIASDQTYPYLFAITKERMFWFASADGSPWAPGITPHAHLFECSLEGCGTSPNRLATDIEPRGLVADATHVYWTNQGPSDRPETSSGNYTESTVSRMLWPPR